MPRPISSLPSPRRRGFTLIELLIVLAIIALLALMALPSMTGRYVRDNIVEAVGLAKLAKDPVAFSCATTKSLPADNAAAGLPVPEKIVNNVVKSVTVEEGAIHIVFGNQATGVLKDKTLTLRPAVVEDTPLVPVAWVCGRAKAPQNMTAKGTDRTTIAAANLPFNCQ